MASNKKHKALRIILFTLLLLVVGVGGYALWLSQHYKTIIKKSMPEVVEKATDSVYHISFTDISVNVFNHSVTITGLKLWPDMAQVQALKQQGRHVPPTLSTVSIPVLEAYGITWENLVSQHSLDCGNIAVKDIKWLMECTPVPQDSLLIHDKSKTPKIRSVTAAIVDFNNPDITYRYHGAKENFQCYMKGGTATLHNFIYNYDQAKDTSVFLYARSGKVRFKEFIFSKPSGKYSVAAPDLDFASTANTVTLKEVKIKNMLDNDPQTGKEIENYTLSFPSIELVDFNWNKLINNGELRVPKLNAADPRIEIRHIRENATNNGRKGSYPNQLLLQVGLKTNIEEANMSKGYFKYTEVTPKGDEGIITFSNIKGRFSNITNIPRVIASHNSCIVKLEGKFMGKSDVIANFDLSLTNKKGGYKLDGTIKNLDGDEVTPQAQVFTVVKVTSFRLTNMSMHIKGDETYGKGNFTVLYENLKISLLKFDSKLRQGKKGPFAFVGSALVLYPSNPMPGKEVRKVTTSFARDTTKGFISTLWQHIYRAAKKTAVRQQSIVTLTDGPETDKGEQPKKGFFKRLLGKLKKK